MSPRTDRLDVPPPPTPPSAAAAPARAQQNRAVRTRDAVLRAAAEVFDEQGYTAATVDLIADRANATKGAVYFHFSSKAGLARAVVSQQHAAWAELTEAADAWPVTALEKLERLITEVARMYETNPLMRAGVRLAHEHDRISEPLDTPFVGWIERLTGLMHSGQADGSICATIDPTATARAIVAGFYGVEEVSARLTQRQDLQLRVAQWWALTRRGLAAGATCGARP